MPLVLLALGFALSLLNRLRILYLYDRVLGPAAPAGRRPSLYLLLDVAIGTVLGAVHQIRGRAAPAPRERDSALDLGEVDRTCDGIDELLIRSTRTLGTHPFFLMALGLMAFAMFRLLGRVIPTPDGRLFTWAFVAMICGSTMVVATAFSRFLLLWLRLRYLLRTLLLHPMQGAYDRLPAMVGQTYGRYLDRFDPRLSSLRPRVQQLMALAGRDPAIKAIALRAYAPTPVGARGTPGPGEVQGEIEQRFEAEIRRGELGDVRRSPTHLALRAVAAHCLRKLREDHWPMLAVRDGYRMAAPGQSSDRPAEAPAPGPESEPFPALAEEFLAMEFLAIVNQYAAHLKSLAAYLAVAPLLLIWAIGSYPFLPARTCSPCSGGSGRRSSPAWSSSMSRWTGPVPQPRLADLAEPRHLRPDVPEQRLHDAGAGPGRPPDAIPVLLRRAQPVARADPPIPEMSRVGPVGCSGRLLHLGKGSRRCRLAGSRRHAGGKSAGNRHRRGRRRADQIAWVDPGRARAGDRTTRRDETSRDGTDGRTPGKDTGMTRLSLLLVAAALAAGAVGLRPLRHLRRLPGPLRRAELRRPRRGLGSAVSRWPSTARR